MTKLRLLPRDSLIRTGPVDHAEWCYRPFLGNVVQTRYRLIQDYLPSAPVPALLELGYGSGIFLPTLSQCCDRLLGLDIHDYRHKVSERLEAAGVSAELLCDSAEAIPLPAGSIDCIVSVSSLEFVDDIETAAQELRRVLCDNGTLVIVTPGYSFLADLGLKLLTGKNAKREFNDRRQRLLPALLKHFVIQREKSYPPVFSKLARIYCAICLAPKEH